MARIRSIKPDFWKSESIARLSMQTRLTFIALWNYVDDNGVGRDNVRLITAEIYPLEEDPRATLAHVARSLDELARHGRVTRYTHDEKPYIHVTGWSEHQKIDKPNKKRYPLPTDEGSTVLTCGDVIETLPFEEPSRMLREGLAHVHRPEKGAGSREQGAEEQGEVLPAPASRSTAARTDPTEGQRVNLLAKVFTDREPMSNFPAVAGVVRKAVRSGRYSDEQIVEALGRLAADGRSVTVETLRVELDGLPASRQGQGAKKASTTDQRFADALAIGQRLASEQDPITNHMLGGAA
jgi:hypothetical protein